MSPISESDLAVYDSCVRRERSPISEARLFPVFPVLVVATSEVTVLMLTQLLMNLCFKDML